MSSKMKKATRTNRGTNGRTKRTTKLLTDIPSGERFDVVTRSVVLPTPTSRLVTRLVAPVFTVTASSSAFGAAYGFALSGIASASQFTSTFDFYRIDGVRVSFKPQNISLIVDPTVTKITNLYSVVDYNDLTPPATVTDVISYDNCMVLNSGESGRRSFLPKAKMVVNGASGVDYMEAPSDWIPCTSDDVLHHGLKIYVPAVNAGQANLQTWTVTFEYFITFRMVV